MSTTRLMVAHGLTSLQIKSCFRSPSFIFNRNFCLANSSQFGGLRRRDGDAKRAIVVYSDVEPGAPPPSNSNSNSWKSWILGALLTFILPFFRHKWGPLSMFAKNVEATVETVEQVAEFVEKVAERVEDVADDIADQLPEGGKLRNAIETVENAAKETGKAAQFVDDIIDKVQGEEKEVQSFMEPVHDEASGTAKDATDPKK